MPDDAGLEVVIDLSHYNEVSSFADIKAAGILGVIHKATEGTLDVDPFYHVRRAAAVETGLWWGSYHFGVDASGIEQAQHFLDIVAPGPQDLLALDFEQNGAATMTIAQAEDFVREVYARTGRYPGFYSDSLANELLGEDVNPLLVNCWLWRAEYGGEPRVQRTWPTWTLWQFTDRSAVPGIGGSGVCDRSRFNGRIQELARLWGRGSGT